MRLADAVLLGGTQIDGAKRRDRGSAGIWIPIVVYRSVQGIVRAEAVVDPDTEFG